MTPFPGEQIVGLLAELKAVYPGFVWESALWGETDRRRSPYRTLALFGLSARTKDALLVDMCRRLFQRFPDAQAMTQEKEAVEEAARSIVRPRQLPFVVSMAQAVEQGVPRQREALLRIHGVGDKIAECVLAYGWGEDALPLDAHGVRVLARVFGLERAIRAPGLLREGLKFAYLMRRAQFASLSIAMVDVHEILRLHGQVCCARTPRCCRCPVAGCRSRRASWSGAGAMEAPLEIWDGWRELIYEPAAI